MIPELTKIVEGSHGNKAYVEYTTSIPEELKNKLADALKIAQEVVAGKLEEMGFADEAEEVRSGNITEESPEMVKKMVREELSKALKTE